MASPKLRFKEFEADWFILPLKKLCKINQGLQIAIEDRFLENGENRFFYITNEFLRESAKKSYFIENPPISVRCKSDDILMTRTGNTGQVVTNVEGAFHNNFFKIDFDRRQVDKNFFVEFLRKNTTQHLILKYAGASTIPDLNHSDFYRIQMPITSIDEQTQIASFLSAVDEKISQLTQKHELLSQYKQGMMQKLFSQQIRFKADDGSEFGEWEKKKLGDIALKVGSGSTPRGGNEAYTAEGIIFIRSQNVNNDQLLLNDIVYISENTHKKMSGSKVVANDILLNITGSSIGRSCVVPHTFTEANVNQHVCIIRVPNDNPRFIQSFLSSKAGQDLIHSHQAGSGREGLNFQSIRAFVFQRPCLEEQTKIANFLSAIDQKIAGVAQQIEQTKQWKKGLLQQMFV
nr:restriction endonuclease subunit S [Acinetobacter sp. YH12049]